MSSVAKTARDYLFSPTAWFWGWADGGEVIAWRDGPTIAFRDELAIVLEHLQSESLPPLSPVVLLLAACRDSWSESSLAIGTLAGFISTVTRSDLPAWVGELLGLLDEVHKLPEPLRANPLAKGVLARIVFETAGQHTPRPVSEEVVRVLRDGPDEEFAEQSRCVSKEATVSIGELRCLLDGLKRLDRESLELRIRTGLDALVEPAEIDVEDLDDAARARRLLRELTDDTELAGLARLASRIVAAVTLPRPMDRHEDLALGGVSDITNRGPLDKLLLTELAHDDLTLCVRIAVGEALYLRHESPPIHPARERLIVIDSGIRLWGVPRVFATAVALALSAISDRNAPIRAFRAAGDKLKSIDLLTRDGLTAHLEALETDAHPGASLAAARKLSADSGDTADLIVITSDDVAADPDFRRDVSAADLPAWYLVTVGRGGLFQLSSRNEWGGRRIAEARFDLESLLAHRVKSTTGLVDESRADLPAVFALEQFPLRMPHHPVIPDKTWVVGRSTVLSISKDRRLMWWDAKGLGARQVAEGLPGGSLLWSSPFERDGHTLAVVGSVQQTNLHVLEIDLKAGTCQAIPLETRDQPIRAVTVRGNVVFVVYCNEFDVLSISGGRRITSGSIPRGLTHHRDRFFRSGPGEWFALYYNGQAPKFEPIPLDFAGARQIPVTFFDRAGCPGPVAITHEGDLLLTHEEHVVKVSHWVRGVLRVAAVSSNGERLVIVQERRHGGERELINVVDVDAGTSRRVSHDIAHAKLLAEPQIAELVHARTLRHRFQGAAVFPGSRFGLISPRGYAVCFYCTNKSMLLSPIDGLRASDGRSVQRFEPMKHAQIDGYTLSIAAWPDGSQAFLDSRGLLHLKSSDPGIPETTIVLHERLTSGWCADGRVWGESYFLGAPSIAETAKVIDGDRIYHDVLEPFTNWIQ